MSKEAEEYFLKNKDSWLDGDQLEAGTLVVQLIGDVMDSYAQQKVKEGFDEFWKELSSKEKLEALAYKDWSFQKSYLERKIGRLEIRNKELLDFINKLGSKSKGEVLEFYRHWLSLQND